MSYTLYSSPGSCSMAVHVALEECNVPYTYKKTVIANGDTRTPEYLKLNPRGQVPVLVHPTGDVQLEGAAQMAYILDTYGDGSLLPQGGLPRAQALQWLMFANATLHPAYSRWFWAKKNGWAEVETAAASSIQTLWQQVEEQLTAHGPYLCGANPTIGDVVVTVIANWSNTFQFGPHTTALLKAIRARPAFERCREQEGVSYQVAA
ncbi:MAG: glutathione S-transferase family protein [Alphaproteobacteria bacterium]|nr:glutathione S-transferase family protein [Alphaproteobacteria bacterium]